MLLVHAIVSPTQRNSMVMDSTTNINKMVQSLIMLVAIQLIHEGASHTQSIGISLFPIQHFFVLVAIQQYMG